MGLGFNPYIFTIPTSRFKPRVNGRKSKKIYLLGNESKKKSRVTRKANAFIDRRI